MSIYTGSWSKCIIINILPGSYTTFIRDIINVPGYCTCQGCSDTLMHFTELENNIHNYHWALAYVSWRHVFGNEVELRLQNWQFTNTEELFVVAVEKLRHLCLRIITTLTDKGRRPRTAESPAAFRIFRWWDMSFGDSETHLCFSATIL
jgi:hypothetical protein